MKKQYFAAVLLLLAASGLPMFGQQGVSIRASLVLGVQINVVTGAWQYGYGAIFVKPGTPWKLSISGGEPNSSFAFCASKDDQRPSCAANFGHTDQNGAWQLTGTIDPGSTGNWTEWIQFPSGAISTPISFGVGNTNPSGHLQINNGTAGVFHAHQQWTLSVDRSTHINETFDFCSEGGGTVGCAENFGTTDRRGSWTLSGTFPNEAIGRWSEWIVFHDGTPSSRISFTVDDSPLDDLTCSNGTIYPIGPNAGYGPFPRLMPDWYPSDPGDYRQVPGSPGGYGNTLEYLGCRGVDDVWLQWAYGSFFGFEVRAPWSGQTDRGLRIGDSLGRFLSLYPAAQRVQRVAFNANSDAWDSGPLRVFIQNGAVAGIRVNWAISEFPSDNQYIPFIASPGPAWFTF